MEAIEISALSKTYRGKRGTTVEALKGLSLSIGQGEVFGFLGPNGAGKSTTIKILMGLVRPSAGSARISGVDAALPASRQAVGYLPENPAFYDYMSAEEYLRFVGKAYGMGDTLLRERVEGVLKLLELSEARKRPMRVYSKGMVQRVGLAQVLIHDPDVYILDEPMSGLDPVGRALVKAIILDLKSRGKSVFFSTHITADVETVCDRVGIILKGELKTVERVETILTEGVIGYSVRLRRMDAHETSDAYVTREDLPAFMAAALDDGTEITLVEPRRKNLEDFFLDIVKGKSC